MGKRGPLPKAKLPMAVESEAREWRYKAEDALRTLQRADECRRDKQLMSDVKKIAKEQMKALKRVK